MKWIHSVYLEGKDWWDYELTNDSSWIWRKLVNLKNLFKGQVDKMEFVRETYSIKRVYKYYLDSSKFQKSHGMQ